MWSEQLVVVWSRNRHVWICCWPCELHVSRSDSVPQTELRSVQEEEDFNCWCFVIGFFLIKKKKNWLAENWLQWMKGFMSFFGALLDLYEPENSSLISQSIYVAILLIKTHYMYLILHLYLTIKCLQNAPCCFQIWEFPLLSLSDDLRSWLSVSGLSSCRFISRVRLLRFRSSLIHL